MAEEISEKPRTIRVPVPMCVVGENGKIKFVNSSIDKVFQYAGIEDADFFALTGIKIKDLESGLIERPVIERNGRVFALTIDRGAMGDDDDVAVFFMDVTGYIELKKRYDAEKVCVCRINLDNYDQMNDSVPSEAGMAVTSEINKVIRRWAQDIEGSVDRVRDDQYMVCFQRAALDGLCAGRFSVLEEVRNIAGKAEFPLSLSIGVGTGGKSIAETSEFAQAALDLALGRGGDQAVVKIGERLMFYGGKSQSIEKSNKGKSRMVGNALCKLIEQSNRVFIMGHRHPDVDCFGSALGIYRLCLYCNTEAHIIIDEVPDSLRILYDQVRRAQEYNITRSEKALALCDRSSLAVVVDTARPSLLEAPAILKAAGRTAVIDHHRRAEDNIDNPALAYVESYASSTAELVTEMLQYVIGRKGVVKLEAEALLAGMSVDTNRFSIKTGVRTFEAAAWLRRLGADTTEVKRFFQTDIDSFRVRAKAIADATFYDNGIATSICPGKQQDAQVINAQVADELLTIRGVKASFVAGEDDRGMTCISARSLGDLNVQVLLERLGGGGHFGNAGAQVKMPPEEVIQTLLGYVNGGDQAAGPEIQSQVNGKGAES